MTKALPLLALIAALLADDASAVRMQPAAHAGGARPAEGAGTVVVPIQGPLSEMMLALTIRAVRRAHELGARAIVFEINTEGGDAELMDRLIDEIERAENLKSVAFVTQKAASAGALVAISCQRLYMKPGSNIGSALPLMMPGIFGAPFDPQQIAGSKDDFWEKIRGHFRTHFRAKAQANGRPPALAEAMVYAEGEVYEIEVNGARKFVSERDLDNEIADHGEAAIRRVRVVCRKGDVLNLTAQEALTTGMIDGLATSRQDLLEQLGLAQEPVFELSPSWSEHLADFLQRFGLLLLVGGLIAIFIEVKVPGFGLPGILGASLLALYLFGKYLAGLAEITEILLIAAGIALIAVEVFVLPGMMVSGVLGALALLSGLVLASQQTLLPQADRPLAEAAWWANLRGLSLGLVAGAAGMVAIAHFFPRIPILNRAILRTGMRGPAAASVAAARPLDEVDVSFRPRPGARGVARTVLRPAGKVEIEGRELDAVSEGPFVESGQRVVVVRIEAAHVVVRGDEPHA